MGAAGERGVERRFISRSATVDLGNRPALQLLLCKITITLHLRSLQGEGYHLLVPSGHAP